MRVFLTRLLLAAAGMVYIYREMMGDEGCVDHTLMEVNCTEMEATGSEGRRRRQVRDQSGWFLPAKSQNMSAMALRRGARHASCHPFACESAARELSIASVLLDPNTSNPIHTSSNRHVHQSSHKKDCCRWRQWLPRYATTNPIHLPQANTSSQEAASAKQQPHEAGK